MTSRPTGDPAVIAFLSDPAAFVPDPPNVDLIETHASFVILSGTYAYKIKKPVKLPFLDFSTLLQRHAALKRELELNQPHAPDIYLEIIAVVRSTDGTLSFGKDESREPFEYVLKMHRFNQEQLLSRIAARRPLPAALSKKLAEMVAAYHAGAAITTGTGAAREFLKTIANLTRELSSLRDLLDSTAIGAISQALKDRGRSAHDAMITRAGYGTVRRCHGDLHLNNIVLLNEKPVPFDALEFDERLAVIDVLYDLAFLLMDLDVGGDRNAANVIFNRYVSLAPVGHEIDGLSLMPLFLASRALVRAVVTGERSRQLIGGEKAEALTRAARYLSLAQTYLTPARPCLVAVGGLSGTGKSTLAAALAPLLGAAPGALHLRSDVERKRLFGVAETVRLDAAAYTPDVTQRVYATVLEKARLCLRAGHAVIIDVVAATPDERRAIATVAKASGQPFIGLWLEAPLETLITRVEARHGDASDANAAVVTRQASYDIGENTWTAIDASSTPADTLARATEVLRRASLIKSA